MKSFVKYTVALLYLALVFSCSKNNSKDAFQGSGTTGMGGSMARFAITNDHLYAVSDTKLSIFDVSSANDPTFRSATNIGFGVETIFPRGNHIFIGTQTGMKIIDVTKPTEPAILSNFEHIRSCDPVVADDKYAYVTLRSDTECNRGSNELQIIDISNLRSPKLVQTYPMVKPLGLAIDGNQLFVCDNQLKWFDASNPTKLVSKGNFTGEATDLIANDGILMVIAFGGLSQYDYSTGELKFLSKIPTTL